MCADVDTTLHTRMRQRQHRSKEHLLASEGLAYVLEGKSTVEGARWQGMAPPDYSFIPRGGRRKSEPREARPRKASAGHPAAWSGQGRPSWWTGDRSSTTQSHIAARPSHTPPSRAVRCCLALRPQPPLKRRRAAGATRYCAVLWVATVVARPPFGTPAGMVCTCVGTKRGGTWRSAGARAQRPARAGDPSLNDALGTKAAADARHSARVRTAKYLAIMLWVSRPGRRTVPFSLRKDRPPKTWVYPGSASPHTL